jgi:hypothetical protein
MPVLETVSGFLGTHYLLAAVLVPIVPAALVALLAGVFRPSEDPRRFFLGLRFHVGGGFLAYMIFALFAYGEFAGFKPEIKTYELGLTLQGPPSTIEAFLKDASDFEVAFRSKKYPGEALYFSYFSIDDSRTKIRSKISPATAPVLDHFSEAPTSTYTEGLVLELIPKDLKLGARMEAVLKIEPDAAGSHPGGNH